MRLAAGLLCAATLGCGGGGDDGDGDGDPTPSGPPTPTAVQIDVHLGREIRDQDQTTVISWDVSVRKDDVPVNSAAVTINGKTVPRVVGFIDGWYGLTYETNPQLPPTGEATYLVGTDYTVTVVVDGVAYSDTMKAPGGITFDAAGASVSWAENGTYASVDVEHLFGASTFFAPAVNPGRLTSPQTIPASAYPSADTYRLSANVSNVKQPAAPYPGTGYFGPLVGSKTHFVIEDFRERRVVK
jgi:hypothetical protein